MWSWCGFIYVKPLSSCFRAAKLANDLQICVHVRLFLDPVKMFSDFIKCQRPRICLKSAVHVTLLTRAAVSSLWLLTFLCSSVNVVIVNKWQTVWGKKNNAPCCQKVTLIIWSPNTNCMFTVLSLQVWKNSVNQGHSGQEHQPVQR